MQSVPATILSAAVTVLAVMILMYVMLLVGGTRNRVKILTPAMGGHPDLERALRVQGNTNEQALIFLPLLWVATLTFHGWIPAAVGLVWCLGRVMYAIAYMKDPAKRGPGFGISALASLVLLVLSIWGVAASWIAT